MLKNRLTRLFCLAILVAATIVLGVAPVQGSAPPSSPREGLCQANRGDAPIVDAVTPKPDHSGKSELFVDGEYFREAPEDVTDFVCSAAKEGKPIVVLGTDLADVCNSLDVGYDQVIFHDGTTVLASVVKLYPDRIVGGKPFVSQTTICGRDLSLESAIEHAQGFLASEAKRTFDKENASGAALLDGAYFGYYQQREIRCDLGTYGDFTVMRTYSKLYNDSSSLYDWRAVKYSTQIVPGKVKSGNGWKNDWGWMKAYPAVNPTSSHYLDQYLPTTTTGQTSVSGTVGVQANTNGVAGVSAAVSTSYSLSDVVVRDLSIRNQYKFELKHDMAASKLVGSSTYLYEPAASWRLANGENFCPHEYYQCQWVRSTWYAYYYYKLDMIDVVCWGC